MELLYLWINHSKNGIFRHQGINLSPEFNFIVEKKKEQWFFSEDDSWKSRKSIFKNEIVENVSAIVGRNGVGKTTLLDYLANLDCSVPHRESYDIGYEAMRERDIREALCIYVFRENDEICIYHNFEKGFENKTDYNVKNMSNTEIYRGTLLEQTDFKDILRIYITNSSYGGIQKNGISRQFKLDEIALTPKGISTIASSYFNKLLDLNATFYLSTVYYEWRKMLKSWLDPDHFQKICDILYFNKLIKEKKLEGYAVNISTRLNISCAFAPAIIYKNYSQKLQKEQQPKLSEICDFVNAFRQKMNDNLNHIIKNLISNLIFEICLDSEMDFSKITLNKTECLEWAKNNMIFTSNKEYFIEAVSEIEELTEILEKATVKKM